MTSPDLPPPVALVTGIEEGRVLFMPRPSLAGCMVGIYSEAELLAAYRAGMLAAAQIADEQARQEENDNGAASTGGAAATAEAIRAAIRRAAEGGAAP